MNSNEIEAPVRTSTEKKFSLYNKRASHDIEAIASPDTVLQSNSVSPTGSPKLVPNEGGE